MNNLIITSGKNLKFAQPSQELAQEYGLDYVPRKGGIDKMLAQYNLDKIFVLNSDGLALFGKENDYKLAFHPGMAVQKQRQKKANQKDYLIQALNTKDNMRILDCTFGLGSDSINIAAQLPTCEIDGLESSREIYIISHYGITHYQSNNKAIAQALKQIQLFNENYSDYLKNTKKQYDAIYFDPMFDITSERSANINQLRSYANHQPLEKKDIDAALNIAPRVVVKHRKNSLSIPFDSIYQGKYSPIAFGVIERSLQ